MNGLLDWVLSGFRSSKSRQDCLNGEIHIAVANQKLIFPSIVEEDLQYIIRQVSEEGFHVEKLRLFTGGNPGQGEHILALHRWAASSNLEVTINHELGICFFEQLRVS